MTEPFLIEQRHDHEERWMCKPPPIEASYQVLRDEWNDDLTVRSIYEIRIEQ